MEVASFYIDERLRAFTLECESDVERGLKLN